MEYTHVSEFTHLRGRGLHVHAPTLRVIDAGQLGTSMVSGGKSQAQTLILVMGRQLERRDRGPSGICHTGICGSYSSFRTVSETIGKKDQSATFEGS